MEISMNEVTTTRCYHLINYNLPMKPYAKGHVRVSGGHSQRVCPIVRKADNGAKFFYCAPTIRLAQGLALPHKLARIAPLRPQTDLGSETGNTADDRGGALEGSLK